VSETLEPSDQRTTDSVHIDAVKVIRAELFLVLLALEHVISDY